MLRATVWILPFALLSACATAQPRLDPGSPASAAEKALLAEIACRKPPQAGALTTALLGRRLIAESDEGADGIGVFNIVQPLRLLGFDVVRIAGWEGDADGDAKPPFTRGPGTAPPSHLSVTVRADADQIRQALARAGIGEGRFVPEAADLPASGGDTVSRLVPGPEVEAGDYRDVRQPLPGVTTISCTAEGDFARDGDGQAPGG